MKNPLSSFLILVFLLKVYHKTRSYVCNNVVRPVVKRADSVKQVSVHSAVKYSNFAAEKIDSVLDVADMYVDKYLPDADDAATSTGKGLKIHQLLILSNLLLIENKQKLKYFRLMNWTRLFIPKGTICKGLTCNIVPFSMITSN